MRWVLVALLACGCAGSQARDARLDRRIGDAETRQREQQSRRQTLESHLAQTRGARLELVHGLDAAYREHRQASEELDKTSRRAGELAAEVARLEALLDQQPILTMVELRKLRRITARAIARHRGPGQSELASRLQALPVPDVDDVPARNRHYHLLHELFDQARNP